jgi:hypothetical protein
MTITKIEIGSEEDFSIEFAICEDIHGYILHLRSLSPELKSHLEACSKNSLCKPIKAGTILGTIGAKYKVIDFGAYDYRIILPPANPERYGPGTKMGWGHNPIGIVCPLDLYDENSKKLLYDKIEREIEPRCGVAMEDILGTLQGNWFYDEGPPPENQLAFVHHSMYPTEAFISIGGIFTDPTAWRFTPTNTGTINREFSQIAPDGNIYCYENQQGGSRIVVEMVSDTKLKIEQQCGDCSGTVTFKKSTIYNR